MADEIEIDGVKYISSKRASELSGYAQDYIGQLARAGHIEARRIGGLWNVSLTSLQGYEKNAEAYKPVPPQRVQTNDPESLISFDGKDYISGARAAKLTGYHQDYVGQLARKGTIISRQVGNRWYVEREGILAHKSQKDRLLGAVQAESVGISRPSSHVSLEKRSPSLYVAPEPYQYTSDDRDLMPISTPDRQPSEVEPLEKNAPEFQTRQVPIRVVAPRKILHHIGHVKHVKSPVPTPRKTLFYGALTATAATIVIVLSMQFSTLKNTAIYAIGGSGKAGSVSSQALTASASKTMEGVAAFLERHLTTELVFRRGGSDFK